MKIKPLKMTPTRAARIRKQIAQLEAEKALMIRVGALRDIPPSLRAAVQSMADTAQLPIELFALNYSAFETVNLRMRIDLLQAQLDGDKAH